MLWLVLASAFAASLSIWLWLCAGGLWSWVQGAYVAWVVPIWVGAGYLRFRHNPDLFVRRSRPGEGVPGWDSQCVAALKLAVLLTWALGARQNCQPQWWSWGFGVLLFSFGVWMLQLAQRSNPFFEGMVRHQVDRGHLVICQGPYAHRRHPGYLGFLAVVWAIPFFFGSSWSSLGAACFSLVLAVRMHLEERHLSLHLPGYADYRRQVRWKLFPGY